MKTVLITHWCSAAAEQCSHSQGVSPSHTASQQGAGGGHINLRGEHSGTRDQRDIPYQMGMCSERKGEVKERGKEDIQRDGICLPK